MELVYLWVEEYKNIKKQGFDFSPRFKCTYNENTNELTVDENEEYVSIFPKNINITAIVGENGSGKSTVLKLILLILNNRFHNLKAFFAIYQKIDQSGKNIFYKQEHKISILNKFEQFFDNDLVSNFINYKYNDRELNPIIERHSQFNRNYTFKHIHILNKYKNILEVINDKYKFDTLQIFIKEKDSSFIENVTLGDKEHYFNKNIREKIYKLLKQFKQVEKLKDFNRRVNKEKIIEYNALLFFMHFIQLNKDEYILNINDENIEELISALDKSNNIFEVLDYFERLLYKNKELNVFYKIFNEQYSNIKYLKDIQDEFIVDKKNQEFLLNFNLNDEEKINQILANTKYVTALNSEDAYYCDFIDYRFINLEKNISIVDLSDGEKEILYICIDFLHHLDLYKEKSKILVSDEIDNLLHPKWKKELLQILIKLLEKFKEVNSHNEHTSLILSSHSPFILSDLPKENVIFLKGGKQVDVDINTFGANIHTLLSHGFFMEDGLMGEFAKDRINKAIKYLNQKNLSKDEIDYCENIISIIGEPILKRQLQKILDSKGLVKVDEIAKLEEEINLLKHRIDILRKNK